MSVGALIGLAAQAGAPMVRDILARRLGPANGRLAGEIVEAVASRAGIEVHDLDAAAAAGNEDVRDAIEKVELSEAPEMIALYVAEAEARVALLQGEEREAPWRSAWRPGTMYLLGIFWLWALILQPVLDAIGPSVASIDLGTLFNLTLAYLGLYMGGHTVKSVAGALGEKGAARGA